MEISLESMRRHESNGLDVMGRKGSTSYVEKIRQVGKYRPYSPDNEEEAPMTGERSMRTFFVVWAGQLVSLVGTNLTGFALAVFVYLDTGSVTQLSFVLLASQVPQLIMTPLAGALVDRWDRRWAMILSDTGAGVATLIIAALIATDSLQVWHLYPLLAFASVFQAFQWPAYSAATTLLVPKEQYGRAAGLVQLAEALGQVIAPVVAGAVLALAGLSAVIFIDVVTFVFAVGTLLVVRFPQPERSAAGEEGAGSLWDEVRFGFTYLRRRRGLLVLLVYFAGLNLTLGATGVAFFPLVLGFASEAAAGAVVSIASVGMVVGSLAMSAWGGPIPRIRGVFIGAVVLGLGLAAAGLRPSFALVAFGGFVAFSVLPMANGSSQAIWQAKVEPDVQGRVFAVRRLVAQATGPVAILLVGPFIDGVLGPAMAVDGSLAGSFGQVIGTGAGRGAALMLTILGLATVALTVVAYLYRPLREVEEDLPDWDELRDAGDDRLVGDDTTAPAT
jgi:DHA3 family macrolide efflux protein-like MFS transporter